MTPPKHIGNEMISSLDAAQGGTVRLEHQGLDIILTTAETDRLGVLVSELALNGIRALADPGLHHRLQALTGRLDYLSEPLRLVEHDPVSTGALLRSSQPRRRGDSREYFELRVQRTGHSAFTRFRQPAGSLPRTSVPFLIDRETLARLIDDLVETFAS